MAGPHQFQLTPGGIPLGAEFAPGRHYFVKPYGGQDGNRGDDANRPLDTLTAALAKVTAGNFDTVHMLGHGNDTSADCTEYRTTALGTLTLNKDSVRWIGHHNGSRYSPRARISAATGAVNVTPVVELSGDANLFEGFQVFAGTATDTTACGALKVSGARNVIRRSHIAGIGNAANDIAGSYSLWDTGLENVYEDCVIGLTTIGRGASGVNSELILGGGRTLFQNCDIIMRATATTHLAASMAAGWTDLTVFDNCRFMNWGTATMAAAFAFTGTAGHIVLNNCTAYGITNWVAGGSTTYTFTNTANCLPAN